MAACLLPGPAEAAGIEQVVVLPGVALAWGKGGPTGDRTVVSYNRHVMLDANLGLGFQFMSTQQAVMRAQYVLPTRGGPRVALGAGVRVLGLDDSTRMRVGPDLSLALAQSLPGGLTLAAQASIAPLVGLADGGLGTAFSGYGASLTAPVARGIQLSVGVQGLASYGAAGLAGRLGPSLSVIQSF